jgi:hypothetical protein
MDVLVVLGLGVLVPHPPSRVVLVYNAACAIRLGIVEIGHTLD